MHDEFDDDDSESENSLQLPEERYVDEVLVAATAEELAAFISPASIENALDLSQNLVFHLNRVLESSERSQSPVSQALNHVLVGVYWNRFSFNDRSCKPSVSTHVLVGMY